MPSEEVYEATALSASAVLCALPAMIRLNCARVYLATSGWADDEAVQEALSGKKPQEKRWEDIAERDPALAQAGALALGRTLDDGPRIVRACEPLILKWWENSRSSVELLGWINGFDPRAAAWGLLSCLELVRDERPYLNSGRIRVLRRLLRADPGPPALPASPRSSASATNEERVFREALLAIESSLRGSGLYAPQHLQAVAKLIPIPPERIRVAYGYPPGTDVNSPSLWNPLSELFPKILRRSLRPPELGSLV